MVGSQTIRLRGQAPVQPGDFDWEPREACPRCGKVILVMRRGTDFGMQRTCGCIETVAEPRGLFISDHSTQGGATE